MVLTGNLHWTQFPPVGMLHEGTHPVPNGIAVISPGLACDETQMSVSLAKSSDLNCITRKPRTSEEAAWPATAVTSQES